MTELQAGGRILSQSKNLVKTITIDNPGRKNALSNSMARELLLHMQEASSDDSRVIVLTGAGTDFCAGADLDPRQMAASPEPLEVSQFLKEVYNPLILQMRNMDKPIVAKVRGVCVGIGWNLALACDLLYATPESRFSQIFTKIGLSSDGGGAYFLQQRLGHQKAFELLAFHSQLTGQEALETGLVNALMENDSLDQEVEEKALELAGGAYLAIQRSKENLRVAETQGLKTALMQEADNQGKNFLSRDFMEGISAFLQKRKPSFKGK